MDARLIIDAPAAGSWNMAVDDTLLDWASRTGGAALRFYQWREPTLSLGYFQRTADRGTHPTSSSLAWVRRATGGGALIHHHDVTYSLVTPLQSRFSPDAQQFVRVMHEALVSALANWGLAARVLDAAETHAGEPPFLCFQRRSAGDVVLGPHKIMGSAQRRHRGALLQHGSLLLAASPHARELSGMREVVGMTPPTDELIARWASRVARALTLHLTPSELSASETAAARRTEQQRFGSAVWNTKR